MLILSTALFIIAFLLIFLWRKTPAQRIVFVAFYVLYAITLIGYFAIDYFTGAGITPGAVYTLRYGLEGAGFGDYLELAFSGFAALALALVFLYACEFKRWPEKFCPALPEKIRTSSGLLLLLASIAVNPAVPDIWRLAGGKRLPQVSFRGGGRPGLPVKVQQGDALPDALAFKNVYRKPALEKTAATAQNIVYIYGESLERTYLDERIFPGLMPGIKRLEASGISFTNIEQLPESWWTMGGMVASQCGLPLALYSGRNSLSGVSDFLGGATCMGDLLRQKGYKLAYMGGAQLSFAGKGKFYASHGFSDISGLDELQDSLVNPKYRQAWGLYDDTLFDMAYNKVSQLGRSGKPFGLFMLTLDTHMPGYVTKSCGSLKYGDGKDQMLNAVHCDDQVISSFIDRLRASPVSGNTVIVLASDHISMRSSAYAALEKGNRKNLVLVLPPPDKAYPQKVDRAGTPFDIGPTVLHELGYKAELGLGRDIMSEGSIVYKTSMERRGFPREWLDGAREFWSLPEARDIMINTAGTSVTVNGKTMTFPILMQLGKGQHDKYYFNSLDEKQPDAYVAQFPQDASYIDIDQCSNTAVLSGLVPKRDGWCFVAGKPGSPRVITQHLSGKFHFGADMIDELHSLPVDAASHRENLMRLLDARMHERVRYMIDTLPSDATVFLANTGQGAYADAYARLLNKKITVLCFHSEAAGRQFYALDYELRSLKDSKFALGYEAVPGAQGLIHVTKFTILNKGKVLIVNDDY